MLVSSLQVHMVICAQIKKKYNDLINIHECINWQNQLDYINWLTIHWIIFNDLEMYTIVSLYDSNIVLLSRKANVFMVSSMYTDSVPIDFIDENGFTFINQESCLSVVWECTQMVLSSLQGLLSLKVQWNEMLGNSWRFSKESES